jgi:rubrerythrin
MRRATPAPRSEALGASQRRRLGDVENDAVAAFDYTASATPRTHQHLCPRLVTWLRCHACQRGYFTSGAPSPQPCPSCAGGRLQPIGLWDLRSEAAPAGMLRHREMA